MDVLDLPDAEEKGLDKLIADCLYMTILASLKDRQTEMTDHGAEDSFPYLDEEWDCLNYHLSDDVHPARPRRPANVTPEAKQVLSGMFASIICAVEDGGKIPARDPQKYLSQVESDRSEEVSFMVEVGNCLRSEISGGEISRDFDNVRRFSAKIKKLVVDETLVGTGAESLAQIFVDFLKCVASYVTAGAVESKITVNESTLRTCFRHFGLLPKVFCTEEMMVFCGEQVLRMRAKRAEEKKRAAKAKEAKPKAMSRIRTLSAKSAAARKSAARRKEESAGRPAGPPAKKAAGPPARNTASRGAGRPTRNTANRGAGRPSRKTVKPSPPVSDEQDCPDGQEDEEDLDALTDEMMDDVPNTSSDGSSAKSDNTSDNASDNASDNTSDNASDNAGDDTSGDDAYDD